MKKRKTGLRLVTLAIALVMILGFSALVGVYAQTAEPQAQNTVAEEPTVQPMAQTAQNTVSEEPTVQPTVQNTVQEIQEQPEVQNLASHKIVDDGNFRILITSDIHYKLPTESKYYGVENADRVQLWVDSVNAEHERMPIDLIIIPGDVSLDHYQNIGTYTASNGQTSGTDIFVKNYVSQLPDGVPVYILPGNHEQYNNTQWKALTGNERQFYVEMYGNLFICLDNFNSNLEPDRTGDPQYTQSDVAFIEAAMEKYPNDNVWLIAHWFDSSKESTAFKQLVQNDDRIKGLFVGHQHQCEVVTFCGKPLSKCGNFANSNFDAYPTGNNFEQDIINVTNSFWGFRELVITKEAAYSQYILADTADLKPYYTESYALTGVYIENERRTVNKTNYSLERFYEIPDAFVNMEHWHFNNTDSGYDVRFIGTVVTEDYSKYTNAGIEISIKLQGADEYLLDASYTTQNVYDKFVLGDNVYEAGEGEQVYAVDMTGFKNDTVYEITFIAFLTKKDGTVVYDMDGETTLTVKNGNLL